MVRVVTGETAPPATCLGCGQVRVGRPYARVCRRKLRSHLVAVCGEAGVSFVAGDVTAVDAEAGGGVAYLECTAAPPIQARCHRGAASPGRRGRDSSLRLTWPGKPPAAVPCHSSMLCIPAPPSATMRRNITMVDMVWCSRQVLRHS